jgi:hypothetical protein
MIELSIMILIRETDKIPQKDRLPQHQSKVIDVDAGLIKVAHGWTRRAKRNDNNPQSRGE